MPEEFEVIVVLDAREDATVAEVDAVRSYFVRNTGQIDQPVDGGPANRSGAAAVGISRSI